MKLDRKFVYAHVLCYNESAHLFFVFSSAVIAPKLCVRGGLTKT